MAAKNIKIFIASADELKVEREKAVLKIDSLSNCHKHLWLKPVWWENDAQRGNQPVYGTVQGGIDRKLSESNVVLFIFYSRLGYYTTWEYKSAIEQGKKIFVYFKKGFSPFDKKESVAYGELLDFKAGLNETVLYEHYNDAEHFCHLLYEHLNQYLSEQHSKIYSSDEQSSKVYSIDKRIQQNFDRITEIVKIAKALIDKPSRKISK